MPLGEGAAAAVGLVGLGAAAEVVDCSWFSRWNFANSAAKSIAPGLSVVPIAGAGEGEYLGAGDGEYGAGLY